jgi:hypothetical protein
MDRGREKAEEEIWAKSDVVEVKEESSTHRLLCKCPLI